MIRLVSPVAPVSTSTPIVDVDLAAALAKISIHDPPLVPVVPAFPTSMPWKIPTRFTVPPAPPIVPTHLSWTFENQGPAPGLPVTPIPHFPSFVHPNAQITQPMLVSARSMPVDTVGLLFDNCPASKPKSMTVLGAPDPKYGIRMCEPFKFYPHQDEAIQWIADKEATPSHGMRGGIVSLEMGLGKTLISLATIARTKEQQITPTLVLCSLSLLPTWSNDSRKFFGDTMKVLFMHDRHMARKEFNTITRTDLLQYDMVVTTYDVVRTAANKARHEDRGPTLLFEIEWHRVIADESQRFANYKSKLLEALLRLNSPRKICLSGTPVKNYAEDLLSQFHFCNFDRNEWSLELYRALKLRRNILMMTFESAHMQRVSKDEQIVHIELEGKEKEIYFLFWRLSAMTLQNVEAGTSSFSALLANFTRLRQACIAPHLIHPAGKLSQPKKRGEEGQEEEDEDEGVNAIEFQKEMNRILGKSKRVREQNEMVGLYSWLGDPEGTAGQCSQKCNAVVRLLQDHIPTNEKTIIFSSFASALILLQQRLNKEKIEESVLVVGSLKVGEREVRWDRFRKDPKCRILLMTFKVGSEGITLVEANNVILIEPWWCPSVKDQAVARTWRIGQLRPVRVFNLLTQNTIEDSMLEKCHAKEILAADYLGESSTLTSTSQKKKGAGLHMIRSVLAGSSQ